VPILFINFEEILSVPMGIVKIRIRFLSLPLSIALILMHIVII